MAAKASSQTCCSSSKLKAHTGSAKRICGCWRLEEEHLLPVLHFNSSLAQSKCNPSKVTTLATKRLA